MFINTCQVLKEKHPDVSERILFSLGVDYKSASALITWEKFLEFASIARYFTAP